MSIRYFFSRHFFVEINIYFCYGIQIDIQFPILLPYNLNQKKLMDELTFSDIQKATGLEVHYMRRVFEKSQSCFEFKRGASGKMLFSNNSLVVWQEIRSQVGQEKTVAQIRVPY